MQDKRYHDSAGYSCDLSKRINPCFECGELTVGRHHVVPVSLGGKRQIAMCEVCHQKIHGDQVFGSSLIKAGLQKRRAKGLKWGRPSKVTPELAHAAHELRGQGESYKNIGVKLDLSTGTVYSILNKYNSRELL